MEVLLRSFLILVFMLIGLTSALITGFTGKWDKEAVKSVAEILGAVGIAGATLVIFIKSSSIIATVDIIYGISILVAVIHDGSTKRENKGGK